MTMDRYTLLGRSGLPVHSRTTCSLTAIRRGFMAGSKSPTSLRATLLP